MKFFYIRFLGSCHYYHHHSIDLIGELKEYGTAVSRD